MAWLYKTICNVHQEIEQIATQTFYSEPPKTQEQWESLLDNMEKAFSQIDQLVDEAKKMGQRMENGLRNRKNYMIEKGIENSYPH